MVTKTYNRYQPVFVIKKMSNKIPRCELNLKNVLKICDCIGRASFKILFQFFEIISFNFLVCVTCN